MSDSFRKMYQQLLERSPSAEDYRWLNRLNSVLPDRLRDSPAFLAEVVLRIETIRCLKEVLADASSCVEKRVATGLDNKIKEAALSAMKRMGNSLPNDAVNVLRRYGYFAIGCTVGGIGLGFISGWLIASGYPDARAAHAAHEAQRKASITLGYCLNEAHDGAKRARRKSADARELADTNERMAVRLCTARYLEATAAPT